MFIYVHVYIVCQGYTPRVLTKYSIFIRKNTTQAHQNEKICQQSTFLTFIIYGHTLSRFLSCFRSFSFDAFDPFSPFLVRGFPPFVWGDTQGILFPQNKPLRQPFPLRIHKCPRLSIEKTLLSLSLSLFRRALFVPSFLVFSGRYIYIYLYSSSLVVWISQKDDESA